MGKKKNKKKEISPVLLTGIGIGLGFALGIFIFDDIPKELDFGQYMLHVGFVLLLFLFSFYIQMIIHEAGHLIAGLLSGYKFSSFRIGSLMLLKTQKGYSLKKYSLAGTGGQCLLIPPERKPDGSYPYKFYHLGGVLINLLTAILFLSLSKAAAADICRTFLVNLSAMGFLCAVINGVPAKISGIATDGYNFINIGKEPFALEAMWRQLKINEAQTEGIRLKNTPAEWFTVPEDASKNNEIISSIVVFSANRAMDELDFAKAKEIISKIRSDYRIIGLYETLLSLDAMTIDIIENGKDADVSALYDKRNKAFLKAMSGFPSVIRTKYAVKLLKENNPDEAGKLKELFEKVAGKYPMSSDIESEQEIMERINELMITKYQCLAQEAMRP